MIVAGTTVIAVAMRDRVFLAADSRTKNDTGEVDVSRKVAIVGKMAFAVAGVLRHTGTGWNSFDLATAVARNADSAKNAANQFKESGCPPFWQAVEHTRTTDVGRFESWIGKPMVEVVFCDAEGCDVIQFRVALDCPSPGITSAVARTLAKTRIERHVGSFSGSDRVRWGTLGYHRHIDALLAAEPAYFTDGASIPGQLRELISIEEKMAPSDVGGEVLVVEIDSAGPRWVPATNQLKKVGQSPGGS